MLALPEGWESDYDGSRWFYRYKPTGETQFHFPREGDEFPEFVVLDAPMPDLAPEEKLESQQQVKRRVPAGSENDNDFSSVARLRATGGRRDSITDSGSLKSNVQGKVGAGQEDDDDEHGFYYQPESFMFLGPGAYTDVSPIEDERQQSEGTSTTAVAAAATVSPETIAGELRRGSKVSPIHSETTTPVVAKTEPSRVKSEDSVKESGIAQLDSREMPHELPANIPMPKGIAEMAAEDTPRAPIETNPDPVEVADHSVLAPIETLLATQQLTPAELAERTSPTDRKPVDTSERDELQGSSLSDDVLLKATFGTNVRHHQVSPLTSSAPTAPVSPPTATPQPEPEVLVDPSGSIPVSQAGETPKPPKTTDNEAAAVPGQESVCVVNAPEAMTQNIPAARSNDIASTPAGTSNQGIAPAEVQSLPIQRTDSPFKIKRKPTNPGAKPIKPAAKPSQHIKVQEEEKEEQVPEARAPQQAKTLTTDNIEQADPTNGAGTGDLNPKDENAIQVTESQPVVERSVSPGSKLAEPTADTLNEMAEAEDGLAYAPSVLKPARGRPQLHAHKTTDGQPSRSIPHIAPRPYQIREDSQKFLGSIPPMKRVSTAPPYPVTPMLNSAHLETTSEADRVKMPPLPAVLPSPTPQPILPRQQSFASSDVSAMSGRTGSSTSLANLQTPSPESEVRRGFNGAPFFFVSPDGVQTPPLLRGDPIAQSQSSSGGKSRSRSVSLSGAVNASQADANTSHNPPVPRKIPLDPDDKLEQRRMSAIPEGAANLQWHPPRPSQFANGQRSHTMPLGVMPDTAEHQSRPSVAPANGVASQAPHPQQSMHQPQHVSSRHRPATGQPRLHSEPIMTPGQAPHIQPTSIQAMPQQTSGPTANRPVHLRPIQESSTEPERQHQSRAQPGPSVPASNATLNAIRPGLHQRAITGPPALQHQVHSAPTSSASMSTSTTTTPPQQHQQQQQGKPRGAAESKAKPSVVSKPPRRSKQQGTGGNAAQRTMSMPPEKVAAEKEKSGWLSKLKKVTNKSSNILQKQQTQAEKAQQPSQQKKQKQQQATAPPRDTSILPNMGPQSQQPWPYAHSPFDMNLAVQGKQDSPVVDPQQAAVMDTNPIGPQGQNLAANTPSVFGRSSMDNPRVAPDPASDPIAGAGHAGNANINRLQPDAGVPAVGHGYHHQQIPTIHLQRHASDASSLAPTISTVDISEAQAQPVLKGHLVSVRRPAGREPMAQIAEQDPYHHHQRQQWGHSTQIGSAGPGDDRSSSPAVRRNPAQQSGMEAVVHPTTATSGHGPGMAPGHMGLSSSSSARNSAVSALSEHEDPRASVVSNVSEGGNLR